MATALKSNGHHATKSSSDDPNTKPTTSRVECQFCGATFASRNALFRHLRTSPDCFQKASEVSGNNFHVPLPKQKVGIRFGYHVTRKSSLCAADTVGGQPNEQAAQLVQRAFVDTLRAHQPVREEKEEEEGSSRNSNNNKEPTLTQTSAAKLRHPCLAQEEECSAASDFIGLNFQGENVTQLSSIVGEIQQRLDTQQLEQQQTTNQHHFLPNKIRVLGVQSLPMSSKFQAERSCTQRVYHYLLPLDWLMRGAGKEGHQEAQAWYKKQKENQQPFHTRGNQVHQPRKGVGGGTGATYQRRPELFKRLKLALQKLESRNLSGSAAEEKEGGTCGSKIQNGRNIASPGRFGSLWTKERRCWHNFADPMLGGKASPSNDPVWRGVDRAKVVEVISTNDDDNDVSTHEEDNNNTSSNLIAVIEIRGDGFVRQQIRRMVGAVIAMTNEWLPIDTFVQKATRSDICVETPLAPAGRQYFVGGRFHFMELLLGNKTSAALFEENTVQSHQWEKELRQLLFQQAQEESTRQEEQAWLQNLEHVVAPRIQEQLTKIANDDLERQQRAKAPTESKSSAHPIPTTFSLPPSPYEETIALLRAIVEQGKWPKTSKARSRVIRSVRGVQHQEDEPQQPTSGTTASSFDGERFQSGSFTVVNPDLYKGNIPLANELFPNLTKAVFNLESELAKLSPGVAEGTHRANDNKATGIRPPSTHCAVNSRAEFVPHVDSGRGQGQSVSMIVGLGDYSSGSIFVEGKAYDIRYRPIEFDGWKQRHWTEPFTGERFSLVWFTPATTNNNDDSSPDAADNDVVCRPEDQKAQQLVLAHQAKLPSFPKLKFRNDSTDALAIKEIFDAEKGCAYELKNQVWKNGDSPQDFLLSGHQCVLDIGAHIGAFSRFALAAGCQKVIAYEPEPNNLELLKHNLEPLDESSSSQDVLIHEAAVAEGDSRYQQLVLARNRNDGTLNTWRHALESYSQYYDRSTKLPSGRQEGTLTRTSVLTVPFFGGALVPGVTFVKMDCEGAEIEILLSASASSPDSWMDVIDLVFEWSFTKEKRVKVFHQAIHNLKDAGFKVAYDGQGVWWDTSQDATVMWPFHSDLVVFAKRC